MICTNPNRKQSQLSVHLPASCKPDDGCSLNCCNYCMDQNGIDYWHSCTDKCNCSDPENNPCQWQLSHDQILELQHFKTTAVGLWATDIPDALTEEEQERCSLFKIE